MEFEKLYPTVLIIIFTGVLMAVGLTVLDNFGYATRTTTTATNVSILVPENGTVLVGASGTYPYLQTISYCKNDSATREVFASTNFTALEGNENGGYMNTVDDLVESVWENETVNCTITYLAGSQTSSSTDNSVDAITPIGSTWIPLIITVAILAIILTIVIRSFVMRR